MRIILIAGASASGKTELANQLLTALQKKNNLGRALLLSMDDYFHEIPPGVDIETFRTTTDFDDPKMMDFELLKTQVVELSEGNTITKPIFDFHTNRRLTEETVVPPDVLIIEGLLALHFFSRYLSTYNLQVFTVYVATDFYTDIVTRRCKRDVAERGRPNEEIVRRLEHKFVGNSFFKHVAPTMGSAQLIITNNPSVLPVGSMNHPLSQGVEEILRELTPASGISLA